MPDRNTNPIKTRNRVLGKSNPYPSLPEGGKTGEVLVKISDESGEVDWGEVQGDGSAAPPFDPTYLEEKDSQQDERLDALEAIDPFDPAALIEKDSQQDDRLDALEAAPPGGGGSDYDDTEVRGLISDNADKNLEQDDRLEVLENRFVRASRFKLTNRSNYPGECRFTWTSGDDSLLDDANRFEFNKVDLDGNDMGNVKAWGYYSHWAITTPDGKTITWYLNQYGPNITEYSESWSITLVQPVHDPTGELYADWQKYDYLTVSIYSDKADQKLISVPSGGEAGEVLTKTAAPDGAMAWVPQPDYADLEARIAALEARP